MTDKQKEIMRIIERHQMPLQDKFDIWHDVVRSEKWMPLVVDLEAYVQEKLNEVSAAAYFVEQTKRK